MEKKINVVFNDRVSSVTMVDKIEADKYIQLNNAEGTQEKKENESFLLDLIEKSIRLCERKYTKKLEDIHNDDFTDWLRDKGYNVTDQTRSGKSLTTAGEIDIMLRNKNGTPESIVEAFRLASCGIDNKVVVNHINKLLVSYDTVGHNTNFVIIYAEASDFARLWNSYQRYISSLNDNKYFDKSRRLISFNDVSANYSKKTDIRIGLSKHQRHDKNVTVYHIFIDMYIK